MIPVIGWKALAQPTMTFYELQNPTTDLQLTNHSTNVNEQLLKLTNWPVTPLPQLVNTKEQMRKTIWYKVKLTRESNADLQNYFQMKSAHLELAEAYLVENNKIVSHAKSGFKTTMYDRLFYSVDLILPLSGWTSLEADIYIKLKPTAPQPLMPEIHTPAEITKSIAFDIAVIIFYIAALLILGIYQSFVYYNIRDKASAYYVGFIVTMFISGVSRSGYFDLAFSSENPKWFLTEMNIYFVASIFFTALQFTRSYFNMSEVTPKFDKFFKYSIWIVAVVYLFAIAKDSILLWKFAPTINLIASFLVIIYSIRAVSKNQIGAKYYLFAWGGFLLGITVFNLASMGVISMPPTLRYITYYAGIYEVLTMSLGLSHRLARFRDIERKETMQVIENQSLHKLVRILCHDIANPLSVITISTQMLKKLIQDKNIDKIAERVAKIQSSTQFINRIIDDVRTLEAVDSGKLNIEIKPICLEESIFEATQIFEDRCFEKNVKFEFHFSKDNKSYILSDQNSLQTNVLANIISNAIKFSYAGGTIGFRIENLKEECVLKICDQGMGIPESLLKQIFVPGVATSRSGTNDEKGTGFGMLLIKSFMESYQGQILVESKGQDTYPDDHGTTVILKFKKAEHSTLQTEINSKNPSDTNNNKNSAA